MTKADVIELSDELCGRSLPLSLFLFTDTLEVGIGKLFMYKNPCTN